LKLIYGFPLNVNLIDDVHDTTTCSKSSTADSESGEWFTDSEGNLSSDGLEENETAKGIK